jgi:predicted transcriptional regulator
MSGVVSLNVPEELKERIERAAQEREENPSSLIASALDLLLEAEDLQLHEVRRRAASRSGKTIPNERVMSWLDSWGLRPGAPPPECE